MFVLITLLKSMKFMLRILCHVIAFSIIIRGVQMLSIHEHLSQNLKSLDIPSFIASNNILASNFFHVHSKVNSVYFSHFVQSPFFGIQWVPSRLSIFYNSLCFISRTCLPCFCWYPICSCCFVIFKFMYGIFYFAVSYFPHVDWNVFHYLNSLSCRFFICLSVYISGNHERSAEALSS